MRIHEYYNVLGKEKFDQMCAEIDAKDDHFNELKKWHTEQLKSLVFADMYDLTLLRILESKILDCSYYETHKINLEIQKIKYKLGLRTKPVDFSLSDARQISILKVINALGIKANRSMILCPSHTETTPSCKLYENTNTAYCFGCGKSFDQIDIVKAVINCDFKTALLFIKDI